MTVKIEVVRRFRNGAALLKTGNLYTVVRPESRLDSLPAFRTAADAVRSLSLAAVPSKYAHGTAVTLPEYDLEERLTSPTRSAAAAALVRMRGQLPLCGARLPDGALSGVKALRIGIDGRLYSPQLGVEWPGPVLVAPDFSMSDAVAGKTGIHAKWPRRDGDHTAAVWEYLPGRSHAAIALVAGYGRFVAGKLGWRAERVMLQRVYAPAQHVHSLAQKYREVPVEILDV